MMPSRSLCRVLVWTTGSALAVLDGTASAAPDLGKRACAQEAKQLCPVEMRSLSRKKVEGCMIARIGHAAMLRIRAEREAASAGKPGSPPGSQSRK